MLNRYREVRRFSAILCETLEPEDCVIQTMPEMSPTKWHLAHTSWFFETFVIKPTLAHYQPLNPQYAYLFNSYYNAAGKMHARPQRGLVSRPTLRETFTYRQHVDSAIEELLNKAEGRPLERLKPLMVLGLNHEQQHQELMLTDIKHAFWMNPLHPMFRPEKKPLEAKTTELGWQSFREGAYKIGHSGEGFHFDNEGPRHTVLLQSFALANRLVTNREYLEFIQEGGVRAPAVLAFARVDRGNGTQLAGTAVLGTARRRLVGNDLVGNATNTPGGAGLPPQLLRS